MAWGLPMLTTDGECKIGLSVGPICSAMARVSSHFSASGISFQANRGLPMSTVETSGLSSFQQLSNPAVVSNVNALLPVSLNKSSAARRMERDQLVVGRSIGLRGGARLGRTDRSRLPAHVDHHDLVAETVHLDEGMVGERAHVRPVICRLIWAS